MQIAVAISIVLYRITVTVVMALWLDQSRYDVCTEKRLNLTEKASHILTNGASFVGAIMVKVGELSEQASSSKI